MARSPLPLKGARPVAGKARSPLPLEGAWAETSGTSATSGRVPGVALRTRNRLEGFAQANGSVRQHFALHRQTT